MSSTTLPTTPAPLGRERGVFSSGQGFADFITFNHRAIVRQVILPCFHLCDINHLIPGHLGCRRRGSIDRKVLFAAKFNRYPVSRGHRML